MTEGRRLLLDEMLSGTIATQLRALGHDVAAVVDDPGLAGTPDEELLGYASANRRCLVTANVRDFAAIHASWSSRGRSHSGLIYLVNRTFPSNRSFVGAVVTALDRALKADLIPADGAESYLPRPQSQLVLTRGTDHDDCHGLIVTGGPGRTPVLDSSSEHAHSPCPEPDDPVRGGRRVPPR